MKEGASSWGEFSEGPLNCFKEKIRHIGEPPSLNGWFPRESLDSFQKYVSIIKRHDYYLQACPLMGQ